MTGDIKQLGKLGQAQTHGLDDKHETKVIYRAAAMDNRGIVLDEPVIMVQISVGGKVITPWIDGSRIKDMVTEEHSYLLAGMDKDWIPNKE